MKNKLPEPLSETNNNNIHYHLDKAYLIVIYDIRLILIVCVFNLIDVLVFSNICYTFGITYTAYTVDDRKNYTCVYFFLI